MTKEFRVYVVDTTDSTISPNDEKFIMGRAEETGSVYTLQGFVGAFNAEEVNTATDIILIKEVEVHE